MLDPIRVWDCRPTTTIQIYEMAKPVTRAASTPVFTSLFLAGSVCKREVLKKSIIGD